MKTRFRMNVTGLLAGGLTRGALSARAAMGAGVAAAAVAAVATAVSSGCTAAPQQASASTPATTAYPSVEWYVASSYKTDACSNPVTLADGKQVMWVGTTPLCTQQSIVRVRCLQMEGTSNEALTAELDAAARQSVARAMPPAGGLTLVSVVAGQRPIAVQTFPNAAGVVLAINAAAPLNDSAQWDRLKAAFGVQGAVALQR